MMRDRLQKLVSERRGAVSLIVAASMMALLACMGLAVDFGFAAEARAELDAALDAAALQAARVASAAFSAGRASYASEGQVAGRQWFAAHAGTLLNGTSAPAEVSIAQSGTTFTATVRYGASSPTFLASMFGVSAFDLSGSGSATITLNAYVDIAMLLDNSSSMLIASTADGVARMEALTPCSAAGPGSGQPASGTCVFNGKTQPLAAPCGFACHWSATAPDYYGLARQNAVQLRFDVLQSATQNVIATMAAQQVFAGQYGIGVFTFNSAFARIFPGGQGSAFGSDLAAASAAVAAMTTPVVANDGDTNFPAAMTALAGAIGPSGDGTRAATPRKNLFIVTDGLVDYGSRTPGVSQAPVNPADCAAVKALGVTIFVLYTPYTPLPTNGYYNQRIAGYVNTPPSPNLITQGLQACASSPANLFIASDPTQINAALQTMLKVATSSPDRLKS